MKIFLSLIFFLAAPVSLAATCGDVVVPANMADKLGIKAYWGNPVHDGHHLAVIFPGQLDNQPLLHASVLWGALNDYSMSTVIYNTDMDSKKEGVARFVSVRDTEREKVFFQVLYGNCLYVLNEFNKL